MATIVPATADSICELGHKVSDTRADLLVGQGNILKYNGENTSAILRDANNNTQFTNANIDRTGMAGVQETVRNAERLGSQANTIAWNEMGQQNAGFLGLSAQNERINEAQSAFADRTAKYQAHATADSFAHLSAQGENGFARGLDATTNGTRQVVQSEMGVTRNVGDTFARLAAQGENSFARLSAQSDNSFARQLDAVTNGTRQVVQSEMGVTRSLGDGFRDSAAAAAANYASLSAQNCQTKEVVAAYGNRTSDQTASVLATLSAQHGAQTRDMIGFTRELNNQAAINAASLQLEASKNAAGLQLQAAVNSKEATLQASVIGKEAALQAAVNAKDAALQAAVNSKESVLQASFLAKESLLEQSKWFALAEKTAMVNKCDIESKLAACCCEIKETVIGTANATQALVQTNESSRVRDALSAAVAENSILRLRREERGPSHYPVPYPYPYPHHRDHAPRSRRGSRG
jgi:hypothetical protein